ncbi:RNA pseudouridylate synthase domain-containing protein, putative [Eimeria praecox]|uniref:Rhomboid-like protease n=1 Tax=Eimeria praecox TaxID=51316 RepID=U6GBL0_9EIME|nr:RNA pseudouridylate synthase domain-containing protein, putative [Eimeria praecox]
MITAAEGAAAAAAAAALTDDALTAGIIDSSQGLLKDLQGTLNPSPQEPSLEEQNLRSLLHNLVTIVVAYAVCRLVPQYGDKNYIAEANVDNRGYACFPPSPTNQEAGTRGASAPNEYVGDPPTPLPAYACATQSSDPDAAIRELRGVGAAGLAAYSTPLHTASARVEGRPQRVTRLLQRLCDCSWASVQRLLRLKEAFVVPKGRDPEEHLKQVKDAKNRRRTGCGAWLQQGDTLYFPSSSSKNSISNFAGHQCQQQQSAKKEHLLFQDEDFLVINKPCGVTVGRLVHQLSVLLKDDSSASADSAETPIPLMIPGRYCSGAVLLCRSRPAASVARKAIARGGFGTLKFIAVVEGSPLGHSGSVKIPLRLEQCVGAAIPAAAHLGGTVATTKWRLLRSLKVDASGDQQIPHSSLDRRDNRCVSIILLEAGLDLLRHQIRAHCAFGLRCPLKGDRLYAHLLERWQQEERKVQESRAFGCLEMAGPEEFIHRREVAALPLHLKQIQWRTFAGGLPPVRVTDHQQDFKMARVHTLADLESQDKNAQGDMQTFGGALPSIAFPSSGSPQPGWSLMECLLPKFSAKHCVFILAVIDLIVYIASVIYGQSPDNPTSPSISSLIVFGASIPSEIRRGQIWRLICPMFLHLNIFHLLVNMFMQVRIGAAIEEKWGTRRICVAYLVCGLVGNLVSAAAFFCNALKVGASTAIFGLIGIDLAELVVIWHSIEDRRPVVLQLVLFGVLFVFFSIGSATDVIGHLAGMAAGISFGLAYNSTNPQGSLHVDLYTRISYAFNGVVVGASVLALWFLPRSCA